MIFRCRICAKVKAKILRLSFVPLIVVIQPFERLSVHFKGPLPSSTSSKFLLIIADEFPRFLLPLFYISNPAIIDRLTCSFAIFGMLAHIQTVASLSSQKRFTHFSTDRVELLAPLLLTTPVYWRSGASGESSLWP